MQHDDERQLLSAIGAWHIEPVAPHAGEIGEYLGEQPALFGGEVGLARGARGVESGAVQPPVSRSADQALKKCPRSPEVSEAVSRPLLIDALFDDDLSCPLRAGWVQCAPARSIGLRQFGNIAFSMNEL
jgi:hypothetical protein